MACLVNWSRREEQVITRFWEDLPIGEVDRFGEHALRAEEIADHLSDEAAAKTYFGRLSASGWHTAAMTLALITDNPDWPLACRGCR